MLQCFCYSQCIIVLLTLAFCADGVRVGRPDGSIVLPPRNSRTRRSQAQSTTTSRGYDGNAAARDVRLKEFMQSLRYFGCTSFAGGVASSATHCMTLPLDVIKTRMQTDGATLFAGAAAVLREAPGKGVLRLSAFFRGAVPTAVGYSFQGATKFGIYEVLKQKGLARLQEVGREGVKPAWQNFTERMGVLVSSAFLAESVATAVLAPLEVLKLRMQTDKASAARGTLGTIANIYKNEGLGTLYKGLQPLALRQIPYTVFKLVTYECVSQVAKFAIGDNERLKPFAPFFAGLVAGAVAAVVSNPADLLLTRLCGGAGDLEIAECIIAETFTEQVRYLRSLGAGMFSGLAPRVVQISAMTSIQFAIYESIRNGFGITSQKARESLPIGSKAVKL